MIHNKHDKLIIVGAGGHGKVCIDIAEQMDVWEEIKVIDDNKNGTVLNKEIIGTNKLIDRDLVETYDFFVAIGDNAIRKSIFDTVLKQEGNIVNLISPHALISQHVEMGFGNLFMPFSVVNADVTIGSGNIVNTSAIIEHDVKILNFCHLAPKSIVLGGSTIKNSVFVGANATVLPKVIVEDDAIIGARTLVLKKMESGQVAKGIHK